MAQRGRVQTDRDICMGSGLCEIAAPDVFHVDANDGTVVGLAEVVEGEQYSGAVEAAQGCPAMAITVDPLD